VFEAVTNSAEVVAAVLGIAVTVVAIIVELAATRYNHRITALFVREPINIVALSFFVLTTLACVWVSALGGGSPMLLWVTMAMVTLALLLILPYFGYVFAFISPINVIQRTQKQARRQIRRSVGAFDAGCRASVSTTIDELQDVLRSAIDAGDRDIAMACVDAMSEILVEYLETRPQLADRWFEISEELRRDADFVSLESRALDKIEQQRSWFEFKIFSQFHSAVALSVPRQRDVANLISIRTREFALRAAKEDRSLLELCTVSFNSYLRTTIRNQDPRTSYYILSQYRMVAEALMACDEADTVVEITRRFGFYGDLAFQLDQPFILEVCAFDLVQLLATGIDTADTYVNVILDALLELDRTVRMEHQEASLTGVRRAQIHAACLLLASGHSSRADRVVADLANEQQLRVQHLIDGLETEEESEYWELTPRGINFAYLKPTLRPHLETIRERLTEVSST